jgi:hypothetical protein
METSGMKELNRIFRKVTLKKGSNIFIDSPINMYLPERSRSSDIKIEDVIKGKELDVVSALETHNVIAELEIDENEKYSYNIYMVNKEQEDFDLGEDKIFFVITKDTKTDFDATAVFLISFPDVKIKINNSAIHQERFYKTKLEEIQVPEKKTTGSKGIVGSVKNGYNTPSKVSVIRDEKRGVTLLRFNEDITVKSNMNSNISFKKDEYYMIDNVTKRTIVVSGFTFKIKTLKKAVGNF